MSKSNEFYKMLAVRESSNEPQAIEKRFGNHYGLYQMGKAALTDIGYYDIKKDKWTGKENIHNLQDFLNNQDVQEKAIREYHELIYKRKNFSQYEGQELNGIKLTKSGIIAAAHLVGDDKFQAFLESGGKGKIPKDNNHISCLEYAKMFGEFESPIEAESSQPQENQQQKPQEAVSMQASYLIQHQPTKLLEKLMQSESDANRKKLQGEIAQILPKLSETSNLPPEKKQTYKAELEKKLSEIAAPLNTPPSNSSTIGSADTAPIPNFGALTPNQEIKAVDQGSISGQFATLPGLTKTASQVALEHGLTEEEFLSIPGNEKFGCKDVQFGDVYSTIQPTKLSPEIKSLDDHLSKPLSSTLSFHSDSFPLATTNNNISTIFPDSTLSGNTSSSSLNIQHGTVENALTNMSMNNNAAANDLTLAGFGLTEHGS